jgi:peptidyl-prolyl cis-trans isomerase C
MVKLLFSVSLAVALLRADAEPGANSRDLDSAATDRDPVVARGKGFEIRRSEMDQVLATAKAENPHEELPPDAEIHVANQLIEIQLVLQKATDAEKAEGGKNAGERMAYILRTLSPTEFEHRLEATHITADQLRLKFAQEATAQASLTRQLGVNVTDADAKKFFDAHPGAWDQPETARVRELLLLTTVGSSSDPLPAATVQARHQQILDLNKRVRAGEDFAALAKQYNEDPASKDTGGEFTFKRTQMEFGDVAFSMKPNQISDVLTNSDGYRIFQLLEIIPAKKVEFASVADQIKKGLTGAAKRRLAPAYINQLRKEADVEILDPGLKAKIATADAQAAEAAKPQAAAEPGQTAEVTNPTPTPPAKPQ